jgi:DNA-directed RNA polymerase subunit RPC12/RpoP
MVTEEELMKRREYNRIWRKNNPEKVKISRKRWEQKNPEKAKTIRKRYIDRHREEINKRMREYYHENREEMMEYARKWQREHKEKVREYQRRCYAKNPRRGLSRFIIGYRCSNCKNPVKSIYVRGRMGDKEMRCPFCRMISKCNELKQIKIPRW